MKYLNIILICIVAFLLIFTFSCESSSSEDNAKQTSGSNIETSGSEDTSSQEAVKGQFSAKAVAEATEYISSTIQTTFLASSKQNASDIAEESFLTEQANTILNVYARKSSFLAKTPKPESLKVIILEVNELNSLAAGNGVIFVTRTMLNAAQNERQKAAILAHEIAHISLGHSLMVFNESQIKKSCDECLYKILGSGYGTQNEYNCDKETCKILEYIGYSSKDLSDLLFNMIPFIDKDRPDIFVTHPDLKSRIDRL